MVKPEAVLLSRRSYSEGCEGELKEALGAIRSSQTDFKCNVSPFCEAREEERAEDGPFDFQKGDTPVVKEGRPGLEKATPRQSHSEDCHQTMGSHFSLLIKSVLPLL